MRILTDSFEPGRFLEAVRRARRPVLLLDYDGTLAPFREERMQAVPYEGVRALADRIAAGRTRLVVVSGRPVEHVRALLGLSRPVEFWGSHGWERLHPDGRREPPRLEPAAREALDAAHAAAREAALDPRVEPKPASVALHARGLDRSERRRFERVEARWAEIARAAGLDLAPFDGGVELRVPGRDKGLAVDTVLDEAGEDAAVAYLGDDLTDEDAFRALRRRRTGGLTATSAGFLVRTIFRPTEADAWLEPPGEMLDLLRRWQEYTQAPA
jgi:trehalose-phosphatase